LPSSLEFKVLYSYPSVQGARMLSHACLSPT
jgi:hypothetical protein